MHRKIALLGVVLATALSAQSPDPWHDPSPHQITFVEVEPSVRIEVLDWGGTGRTIVLLAGSGNTAHVFDDFAPKLTSTYHGYGFTRRGFGASTRADTGYTDRRLADDVFQVIDLLHLDKPVLAGHSMAGSELTTVVSQHPDRVAGLVYLDAGSDPADFPASNPEYMAIFQKLPAGARTPPRPTAADRKTFQAYRDWQARNGDEVFPEAELRATIDAKPDGSMGSRTASAAYSAIDKGTIKRDYSKIRVPVLAIFAGLLPVDDPRQKYQPKDDSERAAMEAFRAATDAYIKKYERALRAIPGARVVELAGAKHYIFLSNEKEVLNQMRAFLASLR